MVHINPLLDESIKALQAGFKSLLQVEQALAARQTAVAGSQHANAKPQAGATVCLEATQLLTSARQPAAQCDALYAKSSRWMYIQYELIYVTSHHGILS